MPIFFIYRSEYHLRWYIFDCIFLSHALLIQDGIHLIQFNPINLIAFLTTLLPNFTRLKTYRFKDIDNWAFPKSLDKIKLGIIRMILQQTIYMYDFSTCIRFKNIVYRRLKKRWLVSPIAFRILPSNLVQPCFYHKFAIKLFCCGYFEVKCEWYVRMRLEKLLT